MRVSSVASSLCTWLIAASVSADCEKEHPPKSPDVFQSPKRLSRSAGQKKVLAQSSNGGGAGSVSCGLISSFCGCGFQSLMSSCLAFEPCEEYYGSKGLSSLELFGDYRFSLFGSKSMPKTRRQRWINTAAHSAVAVAVRPAREAAMKKKPLTVNRRVVVTGLGVVTPLGFEADVFYNNLLEGVSGISEIEAFDCAEFPTRIAGEIKSFSADGWVMPKLLKRADKFMLHLLAAGKKALVDAGITEDVMCKLDKAKCGVIIGSVLAGIQLAITWRFPATKCDSPKPLNQCKVNQLEESRNIFHTALLVFNDAIEALQVSYKKMNPFCIPFATANMGSAMLAMDLARSSSMLTIIWRRITKDCEIMVRPYSCLLIGELQGWMGPNYSISAAGATSNFCILNAANHIIRGDTDMMLCGGSDAAVIPIGVGGFVAGGGLSRRNTDPTKASRPWDANRDGFVLGEGAGVLLLEELEHAKKRGANVYAELLGGSCTADAYHMIKPHPDGTGIVLCIEKALAQSGVAREDVNYINAHATSTPVGDLSEYLAIARCFGQNPLLRVNSTKSMTGHLLGAAGAVEAVATAKAIQTGWIHPNINLENPDKCMDMNVLVGTKKERLDIKVALSNSFGFGGQNSSLLFARYKDSE